MTVPVDLLRFARDLRKQQTDAESLLWHLLRDRRFCGFKFRRQHPLAGYILDFYCREAALAIDLDGSGHNEDERRGYDEERTRILEGTGVKVCRFWNHDVLTVTENVLQVIYTQLQERALKS